MTKRKRQSPEERQASQAEIRLAEIAALGNPAACGICSTDLTAKPGKPDPRNIDHRHDNGVIRGVLCSRCNTAVGIVDLRYIDPELWQALLAWSARDEPVAPVRVRRGRARRIPTSPPTLFGPADD